MLAFLVIAAASCSAGFLLGGLMASSKVLALYERLAIAESILKEQAVLAKELARAARISLGATEGRMAGGMDGLSGAQGLLAKCDAFALRLENETA